MGKKRTAIILIIFISLAVLFGFFLEGSVNVFFSWILIGLWLLYTIKFFQKKKEFREYNSPYNTSFFVFTPILIGIFYSFWAVYDGIFNVNLVQNSIFFLTPWMIFFAFPFLIYGISIIRSCFKKFDLVYISRAKSINSRKFGISFIILIYIAYFISLFFYNNVVNFLEFLINPIYTYHLISNLVIWIFLFLNLYLLIRHGVFGKKRSIPEITTDYIAQRRRRIERVTTPPVVTQPIRQQPTIISQPRPSRAQRPTTYTTRTSKPRIKTSTPTRTSRPRTSAQKTSKSAPSGQSSKSSVDFKRLRPKAGILSLEDFKCIFCFQLPSVEDGRGIVLCPNCKHPAHANEFNDWLKNSTLCSRCDATIPASFRQHPEVIPATTYAEIIREYKKRS